MLANETVNNVKPENKTNKNGDEKAEKDKYMSNSLSDNKREDSGEKVEEEHVVSKFLSGEKDDSEEKVDEEDKLISNFFSDKKGDSQETATTASDEDEDKFNPNFLSDDKRLSVPLQEQVPLLPITVPEVACNRCMFPPMMNSNLMRMRTDLMRRRSNNYNHPLSSSTTTEDKQLI
jgi:hypothetical protein